MEILPLKSWLQTDAFLYALRNVSHEDMTRIQTVLREAERWRAPRGTRTVAELPFLGIRCMVGSIPQSCSMFVRDVLQLPHEVDSVHRLEQWARKRKTFVTNAQPRQIVPGMVFTADLGAKERDLSKKPSLGHTGLVMRANPTHIQTIEQGVYQIRLIQSCRFFLWWW